MDKIIGAVGLGCQTEVGFEKSEELLDMTCRALQEAGMRVFNSGIVMKDTESTAQAVRALSGPETDILLVCVSTWSEDHHLLRLLAETGKPVILHSFPDVESGSVCGVMQIAAVLKTVSNEAFATLTAEPGSGESVEGIRKAAEKLAFSRAPAPVKTFAVGSVGGRCGGMTEIAFDEFTLYKHCGAIVLNISELELIETVEAVTEEEVDRAMPLATERNFRITSTPEAVRESIRYYLGMKKLIDKYELSGLAIKCYMRYMGKICLGYSLLSDEGYACSCEGDVNSAVMMHILAEATGQCVNNTDILVPDAEQNTFLFAHCGSSGFSIAPSAEAVTLAPVRLAETGVCSLFLPKTGTVTAADLVGNGDNLRMSVMVGEAVEGEMQFPGNQAKIRFSRPVAEIAEEINRLGCGHHWMVGYGDVSEQLRAYCESRGIIFHKVV